MKKIILIAVLILTLSVPMFAGGKRVSGSRTFMTGTNIASSSANSQMNNDAASKKSLLWTDKETVYTAYYRQDSNITSSPVIVDKVINSPEPINPVLPIVPPAVQPVIEQKRGRSASQNSPYIYGIPSENISKNEYEPVSYDYPYGGGDSGGGITSFFGDFLFVIQGKFLNEDKITSVKRTAALRN